MALFRTTRAIAGGVGPELTLQPPADAQAGDVLVAFLVDDQTTGTITPENINDVWTVGPEGDEAHVLSLFWLTLSGAPASEYHFTTTTSGVGLYGVIVAVDPEGAALLDIHAPPIAEVANGTTISTTPVQGVADPSVLICGFSNDSARTVVSPPAGMANLALREQDPPLAVYGELNPGTGVLQKSITWSANEQILAAAILLEFGAGGTPDPVQGGSNTTVNVTATGAGQKSAQGGAVAATNVATTGAGLKHASGGSAATIGASASAAGRKGAAGGAGTAVSVADTGAGVKTGTGGSSALVRALASGAGTKTTTGGAGATVQVTATGGGTAGDPPPSGGSNATVQVSASGAGSKTALGGAGSALAVTAAGAGQKHASGGSAATVGVLAVGGGWKATAGGAAVSVRVSATGGGMVGEPEVPPASQTATPPARSFTATPAGRSFSATPPARSFTATPPPGRN